MLNITWPPSGSPTYSPSQKAWRFGQQTAAAAATNPLLALNPSFLLAGAAPASIYTQNSDGTSVNTADGQVTGYVQDLTAYARNGTQTVTNNKPLYYPSGSIKGFRGGYVSGQRRWLEVTHNPPSYFDVFVVFKDTQSPTVPVPVAYVKDGSASDTLGNFYAYFDASNIYLTCAGNSTSSAAFSVGTSLRVSRLTRSADPLNMMRHAVYNTSGTKLAEAQVYDTTSLVDGKFQLGGDQFFDLDPTNCYLAIGFDRSLDSTDLATLFAEINSVYGGL